jgi:hypothetical protein
MHYGLVFRSKAVVEEANKNTAQKTPEPAVAAAAAATTTTTTTKGGKEGESGEETQGVRLPPIANKGRPRLTVAQSQESLGSTEAPQQQQQQQQQGEKKGEGEKASHVSRLLKNKSSAFFMAGRPQAATGQWVTNRCEPWGLLLSPLASRRLTPYKRLSRLKATKQANPP